MRKIWLGLLGLMVIVPLLWARYLPSSYGFDEQAKAADLIAILRPVSSTSTKDANPNPKAGQFVGVNTVFKVVAVLKGRAPSSDQLTVLHFREAVSGERQKSPARVVVNGPSLAEFPLPIPKYGVTEWLAFLKKRRDGRYEPVVVQYDSAESFRVLSFHPK